MKLTMNHYLKYTTYSLFILFSTQSIAVTVSDGIEASENDDSLEAVKIWSELARSGNTIDQYNLARHYSSGNGVQKNKKNADKWLRYATRSGLIQAYLNLNNKAVAPANGMTLSFNIPPELWFSPL